MAESRVFAGQSVRWKRPDFGSIKFNCDGAWNATTMHGGIGWVARDFAGLLQVAGGTGKLMFLSSIAAEAAAVRAAMVAAVNQGYTSVEMESRSKVVIQMVNREIDCDEDIECLIFDIWGLASRIQDVKFVFVPTRRKPGFQAWRFFLVGCLRPCVSL